MRRLLCFLLFVAWAGVVPAQRDPLAEPRFEPVGDTLSINDGVVTALAQDASGLIWVGTPVGLVRYDGYQLRRWAVGGVTGPQAAGTSFVRSLLAAPGGQLWVGLEGEGLARLDLVSQRWTVFRADPAQPGALTGGSVRALAMDTDGVLWAGTIGGGLDSLAPGASTFTHHRRASGALPDDRVQSVLVDSRGDLWVGTWNGLVRRKRGSDRFEAVFSDPAASDGSLAGRIVSMLGQAPDGRIWAGTRQGDLVILDAATGQGVWAERSSTAAGGNGSAFLSLAVLDGQELWIGRDDGIDLRAPGDGRLVKHLRRDLHKPWGLAGNNVVALMPDASGGLWAGSYGGGLQRHSPSPGLWVRRGEGRDEAVFADGDVRSLWQLQSGEIWAGMNERGIAVLDAQLRLVTEIRPDKTLGGGFAGGLVGAITQTADGSVWVGTDNGIYEFSPQRKLLRKHIAGQGRSRRMLATRDGRLWVGTQDGAYRRDPGQPRFVRAKLTGGGALSGNVNALAEGADGGVWVGGNSGLYHVAPGSADLRLVQSQAGEGLRKSVVLGLLVDRTGVLWVDTNAGLHRLETWEPGPARARFRQVAGRVPDGAARSEPPRGSFGANLLDDAQGRIWSHQAMYDPRRDTLYELGAADGVDIGTGWFRSYARLADGRLLFGGSTGVLVVEPERFKRWTYAPPLVVSELRIDGESAPGGAFQQGLTLSPGQRGFSLEFAALDFGHAARNRYRYRLQGFDDAWINTGAEFRVASYGNLAPGDYSLQIQGSNRVGEWSPRELVIPIHVRPAWWQTWWAQLAAVLLAAGTVVAVVQARTTMLRRRQAELEHKVHERTEALQALSQELQLKSQALEASSLTDPLTGLHNRRFLAQHIEADVALAARRWEQHQRLGEPAPEDADLVFFLIDIDQFKQVNDQHGHAAGDAVLVQMRKRLQQAFRQGDYLVRWGGEEFLIAARGTSRHRAPDLAERVRAVVADTPFVLDDGTPLRKTCSVGFAAFPPAPGAPSALDWTAVVDLADAALYVVKRGGRNAWLGLVGASAESVNALHDAAARPLSDWMASSGLQLMGSPHLMPHVTHPPPPDAAQATP